MEEREINQTEKEIASPLIKHIDREVIYHTNHINKDITELIQRVEQLEHEQKILNSYNECFEKEIGELKSDYGMLNGESAQQYELLVELQRRVDAITGETPGIPKQLQSNDDDTECVITKDDWVHYITNTLQELIQELKELQEVL